MRLKTPPAGQCQAPAPSLHRMAWYGRLGLEAAETVVERGYVHADEIQVLCIALRRPHAAEGLVRALCGPDGPARWAEYAPTQSWLAFAGLGPSAYSKPEVNPLAWYLARREPRQPAPPDDGPAPGEVDRTWCYTCDAPPRMITGSSRYCGECDRKA